MSTVSRLMNQLSSVVRVANSHIVFDLGSTNSRVGFDGKVVYSQPSCATYHEETGSIVQLGETALISADRKPGILSTVFPIRQGYITDLTKVKAYVMAVMNQALQNAHQNVVVSLPGTYAIPSSLSPVEKQMLERVLKQAGVSRVTLVPKPIAILHNLSQSDNAHLGIIEIGGQTTEVALFVGQECRAMTTIYIGGDTFTQKIRELVRSECQAVVGWRSAEKLKHQHKNVSFDVKPKDDQTLAIRAKNLLTLNPTTVFLKKTALQTAYAQVAQELAEEIAAFFAQQESELVTLALEQGLYVTGGGSQLGGLVAHLEQQLKTQAVKSSKPQEDVIRGLAKM